MNDYIALEAIVQQLFGINKGSVPINIILPNLNVPPVSMLHTFVFDLANTIIFVLLILIFSLLLLQYTFRLTSLGPNPDISGLGTSVYVDR